jgi:hypothetical protein
MTDTSNASKMNRAQRELVTQIKNLSGRLAILSPNGQEGWLEAIGPASCNDDRIVEELTRWRNKYKSFFQTQFVATAERTRAWLKNLVSSDPTRILFLIETNEGAHIGNYGLCEIAGESADLDGLLRGEPGGGPLLMQWASTSLIHWAYSCLKVKQLHGVVFSNNVMALRFNLSLGFVVEREVPLYRVEREGEIQFQMEATPEGTLAPFKIKQMVLGADGFYSRYPWLQNIPVAPPKASAVSP